MISHSIGKFSQRLFFFILPILFSLIPINALAWNAMGHMVIANIAYEQLKPDVREKVDLLVGSLNKEYPDMATFLNLAYWPDSLRSQQIETFTHWHYIDIPYSSDGTQIDNSVIDTDNAVWALKKIQVVVRNKRANPYDRARFLSFLIHIVGDLHQPLHTVSLFSKAHPHGDKGGNMYMIQYDGQKINTHYLWDKGVGAFESKNSRSVDHAKELALGLMQQYPAESFGDRATNLNPTDWASEGFENARKYVYSTPENQVPSATYLVTGRQIAEEQAALAGYRLANLLNLLIS